MSTAVPALRPDVSIIVVAHNMARELPRTLRSLSVPYQRDIAAHEYEVLVIDNGSDVPLREDALRAICPSCRLSRIDPAPPSPARAINLGFAQARGEIIGVMIDGARMVTPGVVSLARAGAMLHARAVVATLGWYLGSDFQAFAAQAGYNAAQEDALLESVRWPEDGYRLFEISTPDESSNDGWLAGPGSSSSIFESNAIFARRSVWDLLGGADERFAVPGGGLLSFDLFKQAIELPEARLVLLLGEGAFHQIHGGIATNAAPDTLLPKLRDWFAGYQAIRGAPFTPAVLNHAPTLLGTLPKGALQRLVRSAIDPILPLPQQPRAADFDLYSWPERHLRTPTDPTVASLMNVLREAFKNGCHDAVVVIARLARSIAPQASEPLRVLRVLASYYDPRASETASHSGRFYLYTGKAYAIAGRPEQAASAFRQALSQSPHLAEARVQLERLNVKAAATRR